ncbi:prephenate dehydratase [Brachybacterium sp. EF45031]|uniref:prephenate dehydratase n=1 Tax=Brachybacterium sillae TaxID=2810536 RepID=UPI00217DAE7D|nr:prephenate dehydratase [Brachybacterium sillae]MCS6712045.1 prephenate dehydratase [Brachybacterium sillae]
MRYGFLGPETTFTHQALLQALAAEDAALTGAADTGRGVATTRASAAGRKSAAERELRPYGSVAAATADLVAGDLDALMAPIENSVEGGVSGTLDVLAATQRIHIVAEQIVPITFVLAAREAVDLDDVTVVASHTHAQAQVQSWVRAHLPHAHLEPASSTAAAARDLAEADPAQARGRAAVCSPLAAQHFGLTVLAERIEDTIGAQTRFVLVARDGRIPRRTGADKTTVVVHLAHNRSGALLEMLEQFSAQGVNLSRIESRPIGDALGRYSFSLDLEGHLEDRRVAAALESLHRVCPAVHFLGSYPRADGRRSVIDAHTEDPAYERARQWVEGLRRQIVQG